MERVTNARPDPRTPRPLGASHAAPGLRGGARRLLSALVGAACMAGALAAPAPLSAQEPGRPAGRPEPMPTQGVPGGSAGGSMCGDRGKVVSRLAEKYGETRRGYGLQRGSAVVEVYASGDTGSWTILLSTPNGLACLLAAGQNWAPTPEEAAAVLGDPA
ncbi:MAG: hypothetical protein CML43_12135 [Rhodobacteraceae bacterium]|nr:hypothetical protein [Paracoccaceae bacterium]